MESKQWSFPVIRDMNRRISNQYQISYLPTVVVINPDGNIQHVQTGLVSTRIDKLVQHLRRLIKDTQSSSLDQGS